METPPEFRGAFRRSDGHVRRTDYAAFLLRHLRLHSLDRGADLDRAQLGCLGHFVSTSTESMPLPSLAPTTFMWSASLKPLLVTGKGRKKRTRTAAATCNRVELKNRAHNLNPS